MLSNCYNFVIIAVRQKVHIPQNKLVYMLHIIGLLWIFERLKRLPHCS